MISLFAMAALLPITAPSLDLPSKPKLVVVVSIDQFRSDYLVRFRDLFLPPTSGGKVGGFRFLMEKGAWFPDAHHEHIPLATGPGHATLLTGASPYKSGIVGNRWFDRTTAKEVYCVEDHNTLSVGTAAPKPSMSPANLFVSTVGDELKAATGNTSKVFGIALKDRAAILMTGATANGAYWYDDDSGRWITSTYYRKDGTLPEWMQKWNGRDVPNSFAGKVWEPLLPAEAMKRAIPPNPAYVNDRNGVSATFPHKIPEFSSARPSAVNRAFAATPFANTYVLDSALELVKNEHMGEGMSTDLLAINLSSNDYIGHGFGPDSPEVLDVTVRTDRQLSEFFNSLQAKVAGGLKSVLIVVTADHGANPIPGEMSDRRFPAGTWLFSEIKSVAAKALEKEFGVGEDIVIGFDEPALFLNRPALKRRGIPLEKATSVAAEAIRGIKGVYAAYTFMDVAHGLVPATPIGRAAQLGYHPLRTGEVMVISLPYFLPQTVAKGTEHDEPYAFDTNVPILIGGASIKPGVYIDPASTRDIAPTLSFMLGVARPGGSDGRILPAVVR